MYSSRDWSAHLRERAAALRARPATEEVAEQALDLGSALEAADPDRTHAIEMYLLAWKAARAHPVALERAHRLSIEVGLLETAAKIARVEFQNTSDPRHLLVEGRLWLDAGDPDRAVRALMAAAKRMPGDRTVELALSTARREWSDVHGEVARLEVEAQVTLDRALSSDLLLSAARIVRMLGTHQERYGALLQRAFEVDPFNEVALTLLEDFLIDRGDARGLTKSYEIRAAVASEQAIEILRRAGTKLALGRKNPGLGIQLVGAGLNRAYRQGVRPIPGHLAMLSLLRTFSESAQLERDLLSVLAVGMTIEHPRVEEVGLAVIGLELAWTRLRSAELAYPYAAVLARHAETHISLRMYHADGGMALGQAAFRPGQAVADPEQVDEIELQDEADLPVQAARPAEPPPPIGLAAARPTVSGQPKHAVLPPPMTAPPMTAPPMSSPPIPRAQVSPPAAIAVPELEPEPPEPELELSLAEPAPAEPELEPEPPEPELPEPELELESRPYQERRSEPEPDDAVVVAELETEIETAIQIDELDDQPAEFSPIKLPRRTTRPPSLPPPTPPPPPPVQATATPQNVPLARISLIPRAALAALRSTTSRPSTITSEPPVAEARTSQRVHTAADVQVTRLASGNKSELRFATVTRDLSANGMFLVTAEPLAVGDRLELSVSITSVDDWSNETFALQGTVVRVRDGGCGVQLVSPSPEFLAKMRQLAGANR